MKCLRLVFRIKYVLLVALISAMSISAAAAAEDSCPESAQNFWKNFRKSVLKPNSSDVARLSRFPFEIRRDLDLSEMIQLNKKEFIAKLPSLLNTDPGSLPVPSTMRSLVKKTTRLASSSCNGYGNQFRIGMWVFNLTPKGWLFVRAFAEE